MDFYEAGANSDWLLPNRLYRSVYYGAVPIALAGVETGRWLRVNGAGIVLEHACAGAVAKLLSGMGEPAYLAAKARLEAIPTGALVNGRQDCVALVDQLANLPKKRGSL
jgi:succinoglycan biosynthesis protein ExoL